MLNRQQVWWRVARALLVRLRDTQLVKGTQKRYLSSVKIATVQVVVVVV